jgi:hypothetical protein
MAELEDQFEIFSGEVGRGPLWISTAESGNAAAFWGESIGLWHQPSPTVWPL